jgi:hypothetical protein
MSTQPCTVAPQILSEATLGGDLSRSHPPPATLVSGESIWVEWVKGWFSGREVMSRKMIDPLGSGEVFQFKVAYDDRDVKWHMAEETCFRVKRKKQSASSASSGKASNRSAD